MGKGTKVNIWKDICKEMSEEMDAIGKFYTPRRLPYDEYHQLREEMGSEAFKYGYDSVRIYIHEGYAEIIPGDISDPYKGRFYFERIDFYGSKIYTKKERDTEIEIKSSKLWRILNE